MALYTAAPGGAGQSREPPGNLQHKPQGRQRGPAGRFRRKAGGWEAPVGERRAQDHSLGTADAISRNCPGDGARVSWGTNKSPLHLSTALEEGGLSSALPPRDWVT